MIEVCVLIIFSESGASREAADLCLFKSCLGIHSVVLFGHPMHICILWAPNMLSRLSSAVTQVITARLYLLGLYYVRVAISISAIPQTHSAIHLQLGGRLNE